MKNCKLLALPFDDDPYLESNRHRFVDDMRVWPQIEYGHIFVYFTQRLGTFTKKNSSLLGSRWKRTTTSNLDTFEQCMRCCLGVEEDVASFC